MRLARIRWHRYLYSVNCIGIVLLCLVLFGCDDGAEITANQEPCESGFSRDVTGQCVDINECTAGSDNCATNSVCTNTQGSFSCACIDGYSGDGTSCTDIDECLIEDSCDVNASCTNISGDYLCACKAGYSGDGKTCADVDECSTIPCSSNATCTNTPGGFSCECLAGFKGNGVDCADINECKDGTSNCAENAICENIEGGVLCTCKAGYTGSGITCTDLDECAANPCHPDATCTNSAGSFSCACNEGFIGNGATCVDVDECADTEKFDCDDNATCQNVPGAFKCVCSTGFAGDGTNCTDVDECAMGTDNCSPNASCTNLSGSFKCKCKPGYTGTGVVCTDVDECSDTSNNCHPDADCTNKDGGFDCACKTGFTGDGVECVDINECVEGTHDCTETAICKNVPGSFNCKCMFGFIGDGEECIDVDECADGSHVCHKNAECSNTVGNFACACGKGFTGDGFTCVDIDECEASPCAIEADCHNNEGSHKCKCKDGYEGNGYECFDVDECQGELDNCDVNASCINSVPGFSCSCNSGYFGDGTFCDDVDECTDGKDNCDVNAECKNEAGAFLCLCNDGYSGSGESCADINECDKETDNCHENAACTNTPGSFGCECFSGFTGDGVNCVDIDECATDVHTCHPNAACTNTAGSYECLCNSGFTGNGVQCVDVDECVEGAHDCDSQANCINEEGTYLCTCKPGYQGDGTECVDIDECTEALDNCDLNAVCQNTAGSFNCNCIAGYQGNGVACVDIDECVEGTHHCHVDAGCTNIDGSYECHCNNGYFGDGKTCTDQDECAKLTNDCHADASCLNVPGGFECECLQGYVGDGKSCTDINECDNAPCHSLATCKNIAGSFTCTCNPGYGGSGLLCEDIDECLTGTDTCVENAICTNTKGAFECACEAGFTDTGVVCEDIDECGDGSNNCDQNAICINVAGSFKCACKAGFFGNGVFCNDVDDCVSGANNCDENALCVNGIGTFTCDCKDGFLGDGVNCSDIDECIDPVVNNCHEFATCNNLPGTFECVCISGYGGDGVDCQDIDECADGSHLCHPVATCTNTPGSYTCECPEGYVGNGQLCDILVPMPVELTLIDANPVSHTITIELEGGDAVKAEFLFLRTHGIRFGGQVSVKVNDGDFHQLYNHTIELNHRQASQYGIGGINSTLDIKLPLEAGEVFYGANTITIRLNKTDGVHSAIRIVALDILDKNDEGLLDPGDFEHANPDLWQPPSSDELDIASGKNLWLNAKLVDGPISKSPIKGKCASCHFTDGSDLKYFNYSNKAIIARAQFYGLTQNEGEQIASYIRSLDKPNPGWPWNPPFQPGSDLDPDDGDSEAVAQKKAESWMAGAGLEATVLDDAQTVSSLFPTGLKSAAVSRLFDRTGEVNLREFPVSYQFPDWNSWLPEIAPEDLWDEQSVWSVPWNYFDSLRSKLDSPVHTLELNITSTSDQMSWKIKGLGQIDPGAAIFLNDAGGSSTYSVNGAQASGTLESKPCTESPCPKVQLSLMLTTRTTGWANQIQVTVDKGDVGDVTFQLVNRNTEIPVLVGTHELLGTSTSVPATFDYDPSKFQEGGSQAAIPSLVKNAQLNGAFRNFQLRLARWFNDGNLGAGASGHPDCLDTTGNVFRLPGASLNCESSVSKLRKSSLSRERFVQALVSWVGVKYLELVREHELEASPDDEQAMRSKGHPNYHPEPLSVPNHLMPLGTVASRAPAIAADNHLNYKNQPPAMGVLRSMQWRYLAVVLHSSARLTGVDRQWAALPEHVQGASEFTGYSWTMQYIALMAKMLQVQDNGVGIKTTGFELRSLHPWRLYSTVFLERYHTFGALTELNSDLWRLVFEEYTYELMSVLESYDLQDGLMVPRHVDGGLGLSQAQPTPFSNGAKYFEHPGDKFVQYFYRLMPVVMPDGVDPLLLKDIVAWCKNAWPLGLWDTLVSLQSIYDENFEDQAFDFKEKGAALELTAIKSDDYVNTTNIAPRNGGGKFVGSVSLFSESQQDASAKFLDVNVENIKRLRVRARVAFEDSDGQGTGIISFKMFFNFDGDAKNYVAEDVLSLDSQLLGKKFQSYLSYIDLPFGAKELTGITLSWNRIGGAGAGTAYVDNIHLTPVQESLDELPPSAPSIQSVDYMAGMRPEKRLLLKPGGVGEGVRGYNLYRYADGQNEDTKVKLNIGLIDTAYGYYTELTAHCDPCVEDQHFHYQLTAVDAAGNESEPSEATKSVCWPAWDPQWTADCPAE